MIGWSVRFPTQISARMFSGAAGCAEIALRTCGERCDAVRNRAKLRALADQLSSGERVGGSQLQRILTRYLVRRANRPSRGTKMPADVQVTD